MLFKMTSARRSYTPLSVVQHAERTARAHTVVVRSTPTPDAHTVVVSEEVYEGALNGVHGARFDSVVW